MTTDLDTVLWGLQAETGEPSVIVDPTLPAFCLMRSRMARGTASPRDAGTGRLPLEVILAYLEENA